MCCKVASKFTLMYFWIIVALNFQTAGMEMDLNDGLFNRNGCSGYILKPEILRKRERLFDPENPEERDDCQPLKFYVKVLNNICVLSPSLFSDFICWFFLFSSLFRLSVDNSFLK